MTLRKAVGYIRRSDEKQQGNHSFVIQKAGIVRAAESRGYEIVCWFDDDGVSAFRRRASQRPKMKAMVDYVLREDCDAVFFYDESRISRQVTDFVAEVWEAIGSIKPDVKFFSASSDDDREWDPNDLQTQLRLVLASEESAVKSRRAVDSQQMFLKPDDPKRPGSKAPYGFDQVEHLLVANDDAPIVYFIFHLASWGYSDEKVASILNEAHVPSPSGGQWNASTIDMIVNNRAYAGHLAWNVRKNAGNSARKPEHQITLFKDVYDPIIPPHLWETVHGLRRLKKSTGRKFRTGNLLDGIAICKRCGVTLRAKDQSPSHAKGQYVKYCCPQCEGKITARDLHKVILGRITQDWMGQTQANRFTKHARPLLQKWLTLLEKEKKSLLEAKERATLGIHDGTLPKHVMRSFEIALVHSDERLREVQSLAERISALKDDPDFITSLGRFGNGVFERLSETEQRAFLLATVEKVEVIFGNPNRIDLEYRLSPFVALETEVGRLTESSSFSLGEKPKAQ